VSNYLDIALIKLRFALIASVILQSKGVGLGGLSGMGYGGSFLLPAAGLRKPFLGYDCIERTGSLILTAITVVASR